MRVLRLMPSSTRSGRAAMIAIVVVLLIILVTMGKTWFEEDPATGKAVMVTKLDETADAACAANRMSLRTNLVAWRMTNSTTKIDQNVLSSIMEIPECKRGGVYLFGTDDNVYCTKHYPPPPDMMKDMITLSKTSASSAANAPPVGSAPTQPIVPNLKLVDENAQPAIPGDAAAAPHAQNGLAPQAGAAPSAQPGVTPYTPPAPALGPAS